MIREVYSRFSRPKIAIAYAWNTQNRLTEIRYSYTSRPGSLPSLPDNTLQFGYDDNGNRVRKTVNGENSYYINDGLTVLNELDSSGNVIKSIVKGIEQIAELNATGAIKYVHQDVLDSTALITDDAGTAVQEYEYDPFGELIGSVGMEDNKYLFTGQEYDEESELYYYNARYYNPALGRFISRDAVSGRDGAALSRNGYIYVENNPTKYTDPSGNILDTALDVLFIAYDIGAIVYDELTTNGQNRQINILALSLDVGATFIPVVTGAGAASRAANTIKATDKHWRAPRPWKGQEKWAELVKSWQELAIK